MVCLIAFVITIRGRKSQEISAEPAIESYSEAELTSQNAQNPAESIEYAALGQIRARTEGNDSSMVIISVAFPYNSADKPFSEELTARMEQFRGLTTDYFEGKNSDDIKKMSDSALKTALLDTYNSQLRLGKIDNLLFTDYVLIN